MPKLLPGYGENAHRVVVSLCDYSGNWPRTWHLMGHSVLCYDLKHGDDVTKLTPDMIRAEVSNTVLEKLPKNYAYGPGRIVAVLAAPPCTDFSVSGAQYWPAKDADGTTAKALAVVDACVTLARTLSPNWWMLENPVGRLHKLREHTLGRCETYVQPHNYAHLAPAGEFDAERYTKKTGLWGRFNATTLNLMAQDNGGPIRVCAQGSWLQKLGGKSERTKELRSMTPKGLAHACYLTWLEDSVRGRV